MSVKVKLTAWITALLLVLVAASLLFLMSVTSTVVTENAANQLETTIRANLTAVSRAEDGTLSMGEGFSFVRSGVYTLLYNESGALLAGQPPLDSPDNIAFENGSLRTEYAADGDAYYILDFWLPFSWDDGLWVRGLMQVPESTGVTEDLLEISLLLLLLMVAVGGVGAYVVVRSAFRPLDKIVAAAESIGEGRDLSRRIGLKPGRDEVSRLATAFDSMFARLERSFEAEKQFTSDASHELRTPIAVILAQCAEAAHHHTEDEHRQDMAVIDRQARKMQALVQQLLQMTRLEQGTQRAAFEEADLSELVSILCEEQPELPEGVTLHRDIQPDVTAVFDVMLLSRLLQNLLNNAIRYGRPDGNIWVTLRRVDREILLSVRDDGPGMAADQLDKIFTRFYQADPSRSGSGTGLGLTMVQQIAHLHGGRVTVDSTPGRGSCFTFQFPAEQPTTPEEK